MNTIFSTPTSISTPAPINEPTSSHELTHIEIDQHAFFHNARHYKNIIGQGYLAAVIKSNAYGHDQQLIARLCEKDSSIDWLCVASLSEGIHLRLQGIQKPILILSYLDHDISQAGIHTLDFMCYEKDILDQANSIGQSLGITLRIHVKVDTGVSRFGLMPHEVLPFIRYAQTLSNIKINGIFTHFAQAHHEDQSYTLEQHRIFEHILEMLEDASIQIPYRHCANSAATTTLSSPRCNYFRVGAGLYGIWPSASIRQRTLDRYAHFSLKNTLTWKTTIIGIRLLPSGTPVGYDRTFITARPTTIALLPVGYYDGLDRRLSNKGVVYIHHQQAPIIGRVCMNVCMVDVTDIPQTKKGDSATLIGNQPGIHPKDIADTIASFNPREIMSRINPAIKRILSS